MKKENNFISPEFAKEFAILGIRWKSSAYWKLIKGQNIYVLKEKLEPFQEGFPAYNLTELGHLIPFGFFNQMKIHKYLNGFFKLQTREKKWKTFTSEADARGNYLIELIKAGEIKIVEKVSPEDQVEISPKYPVPSKK